MFGPSAARIELPSMPTTLACIIRITRDPDSSPQDLAEAVMTDQSLTSRVLRLSNSAYFRRSKPVGSVHEAILTLGFGYVRNLAASASVVEALFPRRAFPWLDWQSLWKHSVTCAVASESISGYKTGIRRRGDEGAFVAGLLHDVGKLAIACALPVKFLTIVEACHEHGRTMAQMERKIIGTDHATVGRVLAEQWGLPDNLVYGIGCHHSPENAGEHYELARAVQAGNMLAERLNGPCILGLQSTATLRGVAETAGVEADAMDFIVTEVRRGVERSGELLSWGREMPENQRAA